MPAAYAFLTASGAVKSGPGLLVAIALTAAGASQISIKDGGSGGSEFLGMRTSAAETVCFQPAMPIAFKSGLYVNIDSGTVEVTVAYI